VKKGILSAFQMSSLDWTKSVNVTEVILSCWTADGFEKLGCELCDNILSSRLTWQQSSCLRIQIMYVYIQFVREVRADASQASTIGELNFPPSLDLIFRLT
jgi:hypothetical protein